MSDYKKMYCTLFNEITKVIEQLQSIQQKMEDLYINSEETPIVIVKNEHDEHTNL